MSWPDFYLVCFLIGLILSALSFLFGHAHLHLGHGHGHIHGPGAKGGVAFFNFGTATAFLAWFGGAGFLLTRYSTVWTWLILAGAVASGLAGAALVFWFLVKLMATERSLDPADFALVGALGRLSAPIRDGGTGEMIFSQQGSRRSIGARSDGAGAIPKGTEVVITRYERGIAYVRRWDELAG
jgi:membrane protein implicated in regulation of membrane protease activity